MQIEENQGSRQKVFQAALTCCCQDKNQNMMLVHLDGIVDHFLLGQRNYEDGYVGYEKRCGPTNLAA